MGRNYVPIMITVISIITMLVSHNVICFGYFIHMSHGFDEKAPPALFPIPLPYPVFTKFFVALQGILCQTFFALIRLLQ